jgi:hypothetical protein
MDVDLNPQTPPAEAAPAEAAPTPAPETPPAASSEAPPSPSAEGDPPAEPAAAAPAEPTAEEAAAAAAALAAVPETPDGYQLKLSEAAKTTLGSLEGDPVFASLREAAKEKGWTQGQFNERIGEAIEIMADKGLLVPNFDPAAEIGKLSEGGKDGKARQQEVQVFADSLKARGDIDDAEYGELMSLAPTAAGVKLVEKLRAMAATGGTALPGGDGGATAEAQKEAAREMRRDERYDKDPTFRREADLAYRKAWGI